MKKQTISTIVIVSCICILQSCAFRPCTSLSVNVGVQNSSFCGDSDSWTNAFGALGGVAVQIPYTCNLPFTYWVEGNVSMQGARYEDDWGYGTVEGLTRLLYANFPLTARYQLDNGFFGEAGLQPGILLGAKDKVDGESWDYKEWVNTFDVGIPLGVGYNINKNLGVSLRVIPGITNVNAGEGVSRDRNFVVGVRGTYTLRKE